MDAATRVAEGFIDASRRRALGAARGEVVEIDGLVMTFTNLADGSLNGGHAAHDPRDPAGAVAAAEAAALERGQPLGLDIERGRFPGLEKALTAAGLTRLFSRPAMVMDVAALHRRGAPPGLAVVPVRDAAGLAAMVEVEIEAFGTDPEVARGLLSDGMVRDPQTRPFVGKLDGHPVGQSIATHHERSVGIFGVGVRSSARRRGIGTAMTVMAATAFPPADLAWLHPTPDAGGLYERLGFREVAVWDVWTRPVIPG
jgi:GNAT superfamily N-acetyltransferase